MHELTKVCRGPCGRDLPLDDFGADKSKRDGHANACAECERQRWRRRYDDAKRRQASDFEAIRPDDDVTIANDGRRDPNASADRRQEYSRSMGDFLGLLRASGGDPARMPEPEAAHSAQYVALVSEQERRFQNRRLARSATIYAANEGLHLRLMMQLARDYFADKVTPTGYARRAVRRDQNRTTGVLLSDLHFGSDLSGRDNRTPYGAEEESRRFAKVVAEVEDHRAAERDRTRLLVCLNGDVIEGDLGHDRRDGAPLVEQKGRFLSYLQHAIARWAAVYPHVHVECQPGNHGRDKWRHPGRATSSKWDGHEWWLGYTLAQICRTLPNVTFSTPFRAVSIVEAHGWRILQTHGDTEIKLGDPDTKSTQNEREVAHARTEQGHFDAALFGHFHKARFFPWREVPVLFNGALVPPNGHSRASGYTRERCGQWIFEVTPEAPIAGIRFVEVGAGEDRDAGLNRIVPAFSLAG